MSQKSSERTKQAKKSDKTSSFWYFEKNFPCKFIKPGKLGRVPFLQNFIAQYKFAWLCSYSMFFFLSPFILRTKIMNKHLFFLLKKRYHREDCKVDIRTVVSPLKRFGEISFLIFLLSNVLYLIVVFSNFLNQPTCSTKKNLLLVDTQTILHQIEEKNSAEIKRNFRRKH